MTTMRGVSVAGLLLVAAAMTGVAAANQPPQAEAGLDQEAVVNQTVYLDAGGSLDPDGRIVEYRWSIETPGGTTTAPDCVSCALTQFVPRQAGTYHVTVTVTDDQNASMSDTMYIEVGEGTPSTDDNAGKGTQNRAGSLGWPGSGGSDTSGSGYAGGNADTAAYNSESGYLRLREANGGGINLGGDVSDPHGEWLSANELDNLVEKNLATKAVFDDDVVIVTDEDLAKDLAATLEEGPESVQPRYNDYQTSMNSAEQDADEVLEEHGISKGGSSGDFQSSDFPTNDDSRDENTQNQGGKDTSTEDSVESPRRFRSSSATDSSVDSEPDIQNVDVGYSSSTSSQSSTGGIEVDLTDVEVDTSNVNVGPVNPDSCTGDDCIDLNVGGELV
jgi:hypothetical protein